MASARDGHFTTWLDLTADLVRRPGRTFPRTLVSHTLASTFGTAVAWNRMTSTGDWDYEPVNYRLDQLDLAHMESWEGEALANHHPLIRWYQTSLDPAPMSMDEVPDSVVPRATMEHVRDVLRPLELEHQLSIPYRLRTGEHLAFVLGTTGEAFTCVDVALATRIQPLICLVARQYAVLANVPAGCELAAACELTAMELAVLVLVEQNLTAVAIGHRLGISARTVHKHLEHIYTKLGVRDRVSAVRVAHRMGLYGVVSQGPGATCARGRALRLPAVDESSPIDID